VDTVSNFMRKFGYHVAEVGVAYKERITDVKDAMRMA
jgi:small conductance mechanosensitive channel